MDKIDACVDLLRRHNLWRRGDENVEMVDVALLGTALDIACEELPTLRAHLAAAESRLREYEDAPVVGWIRFDEIQRLEDEPYTRPMIYKERNVIAPALTPLIIRPRGGKGG